jgi:glutathione synthase/RimK-type ligase-like ATP-grasp enzyme
MTASGGHVASETGGPLKIGLIAESRYLQQAQPAGLRDALLARNQTVEVIVPEASAYVLGDDGWLEGLDLIVSRGRSVALRLLLRWAESKGVTTINRSGAISAVFNKAEMAVTLQRGGVPVPAVFLGPTEKLAERIPKASYPVILKPVFGDNCRDLRIVHSVSELAQVDWLEPAALAQRFLPGDGYDLKLYGIGKEVWAVRKPSCLVKAGVYPDMAGDRAEARAVQMTPAMERIALRCAELFGLELYGVDCVETPEGPVVIEVNDFPNYTAVPGANEKLAGYVLRRALKENGNA